MGRGKFMDLIGERFGRLLVINLQHKINGAAHWNVKCDCGAGKVVSASSLRRGDTKSCGCLKKIIQRNRHLKHGKSRTATYHVWRDIKTRCFNKNSDEYKNYGGRNITMCDRWLKFENFFKDMGVKPIGLTIDRINNNGNYELNNCKWATREEQCNNKRTNRIITHEGISLNMSQWAKKLGIQSETLKYRLDCGWTIQRAFATL